MLKVKLDVSESDRARLFLYFNNQCVNLREIPYGDEFEGRCEEAAADLREQFSSQIRSAWENAKQIATSLEERLNAPLKEFEPKPVPGPTNIHYETFFKTKPSRFSKKDEGA